MWFTDIKKQDPERVKWKVSGKFTTIFKMRIWFLLTTNNLI